MRTTLDVDDDLLVQIDSLAQQERKSRREMLNAVLRRGLREQREPAATEPIRCDSRDLGRCLLPSLDDIGDALAVAEGEAFH